VPKVLAEGLAPEDFLSYYKQQYRWTRGSLEVIFKQNPFFKRGLTLQQKLQYVISASYYLNGIVVLIDAMLPVIFLYTGMTAVNTSTMALALVFIPYIFLNLFTLQRSSHFSYTFEAISFSLSSFYLQKTSFAVTSKSQLEGNFAYLVTPHLLYLAACIIGVGVGLMREGLSASLLANVAWAVVNITIFVPFILASMPVSSYVAKASNAAKTFFGYTAYVARAKDRN
jgi:cellulose synthase (UDP-forming)